MKTILAGQVRNFVPIFYASLAYGKIMLGNHGGLLLTVDTGFSDYLALPRKILANLNVKYIAHETFILANGKSIDVKTYKGKIVVKNKMLTTLFIEGDCLMGMRLLSELGNKLIINFHTNKVKLVY